MEKRHKIFAAISLSSVFILGATIIGKAIGADAFGLLKVAAPASEYKIVLNGTNHLTSSEIANQSFTRNTNLGNPISYSLYGGNSVAENANNFLQSRDKGGWFCNNDKINGITKIVVSGTVNVSYKLEFSNSAPLNHAADQISACSFDSGSLSSGCTYEIPEDKSACYFRYQPDGNGNNWVKFEIYYSCVAECNHEWVHHDKVAGYHEQDGIIEYSECSKCGELRNANDQIITSNDLVDHPRLYELNCSGGAVELDAPMAVTGIQTIDLKFADPSGRIYLKLMYDWNNLIDPHNGINFTTSTEGELFAGVSVRQMSDLWTRVIIDFSKLNWGYRCEGTVPEITMLHIDHRYSSSAATVEINSAATNFARGKIKLPGVNGDFNVTQTSIEELTINVDAYFNSGNDTKLSLSLLDTATDSGWGIYYGYYDLYPTTKTGDYAGVTVTKLDDGYTRFAFKCEDLTKKNSGITPTYITHIYLHGNWSTATAFVDVSTSIHEHSLIKHDAVSPFRQNAGTIEYSECSECGKLFDTNGSKITSQQITDPSRLTRYESGVDKTYHFAKQIPNTEIMTIDLKADNASETTAIALMQDWDNYYGYYSIYGDGRLGGSYQGVFTEKLVDGYIRITFNLNQLNKINGVVSSNTLTGVSFVYVRGAWTSTGGYIDCNVKGGQIARGSKFNTAKDLTIDFDKQINGTSTVNVDIFWLSDETTHVNIHIGDWKNCKGYFRLTKNTKTGDFNGLVVSSLNDGYIRYSFTLNQCTNWVQDDKTREYINFDHVYIRGGWSTAEGWCDVSYVENLDSPVVGDIY